MTYPYSDLPATRTNDTLTANTHPSDHNQVAAALNALKVLLGAAPQGSAASVTARLAALDTLVGTLNSTLSGLTASGYIHTGVGVPSNTLGQNKDVYIDVGAWNIYYKQSGDWGAADSLIGPQGPQGPAGGSIVTASQLPYSGTAAGLAATNVQAAIDELDGRLDAATAGETHVTRSVSGLVSLDMSAGTVQTWTLTGPTTLGAIAGVPPTGAVGFTLIVMQDATGGRVLTWQFAGLIWPKGVVPTQTTSASARDVYVFFTPNGVTWYGFQVGQNVGVAA